MHDPIRGEWYVLTKLHPPYIRNHTIHRPHIDDMLVRSVSTRALTLLSAPAGYGKTTLLASIPSLLPDYPIAWITLDEEDNDPVRFIGLLAAALVKLHPQCGQSVWPHLSAGILSSTEAKKVIGALINDIMSYHPRPFILILDDLHFVNEPIVYQALDHLLEQRPPNLYMAIGTRNDPPIRLNRLAARRQLGELRRSDLSLDLIQAQQLLNESLNLNLSSLEVKILQDLTEGWPGVLCLLAGPLGRMEKEEERQQFVATLRHGERKVHDFLAEEILFDLPEHVRSFLLKTSILAEITPRLCRAVTGREDANIILADLYRRNLAIAEISMGLEGEPVYRYHSLFARMLTERLKEECGHDEVIELHRKAAKVQTTPGRAIAHYLSAGLWDEAVQQIVLHGMDLLYQGMAETIKLWYNRLPTEVRDSYCRLTILMARSDIHRGDYKSAGHLLDQAAGRLDCKEDEADILTSQITLAYDRGDRESVARYAARSLSLPLSPVGLVAVRLANAWLHLIEGNWDAVCANVREALKVPSTTNDRRADLIGTTYTSAPMAALKGCMQTVENYCVEVSKTANPDSAWYLGAQELGSWILLWRGETSEALLQAERAEALRQRLGGYPFVGNDLPILLNILYLAKGELEAATSAVELLPQRIKRVGRNKSMLHLHAAGRFLALSGRSKEAMLMLMELEALDHSFALTHYLTLHLRGLIALLDDDYVEATAILGKALELEKQLPMAHVGGSARLLLASLLLEQKQPKEAVTLAQPVLEGWHRDSLPGFVLLDGPVILPILKLARDYGVRGTARMVGLFHENDPLQTELERENGPIEPLSSRELDVLRLLVGGYTNIQIGTELHISRETVKTHVSNIFRKLSVTSRTQAAVRARDLGY